MRLPEPMLAKSAPLPDGPEWRFELKLDGFRAIVSTTGGLRVLSSLRSADRENNHSLMNRISRTGEVK